MLVADAQPTDQLAAGQGHLVGGIDLPDVVRGAGAGPAPRATGRGRLQAGAGEPALEGAHVRQGGAGEAAGEVDAQEAGAPAGVLLAQGEGVGAVLGVGARPAAPGAVARRVRARRGLKGAQQVASGAQRQAEAVGQGGGIGFGLGGLPEGGAEWQRRGGGHDGASGDDRWVRYLP